MPMRPICRVFALLLMTAAVAPWGTRARAGQESPAAAARAATACWENVLGTTLTLVIHADSPADVERAEAVVLSEIDRLAGIVSTWDPTSEFSRWQRGPETAVTISPELWDVFSRCDHWQLRSRGAFNPGVQAACLVWKQAARDARLPGDAELARAVQLGAAPVWKLDANHQTVARLTECPVTFDALAKGDIVERAAAVALEAGPTVRGIVVAIGGDLRVAGNMTHTVEVTDPFADADNAPPIARLVVRNRAVATSGGYRRGVRIGGQWYSHLLDPRTGRPVDHIAGATVVAPHAADADALATICSVLPVVESLELIEQTPGAACLLVTRDGQVQTSHRWPQFAAPATPLPVTTAPTEPVPAVAALFPATLLAVEGDPDDKPEPAEAGAAGPAAPADWPDGYEMLVQFEVKKAGEGRRYRRPYLAVWIENPEGEPVRTLAVWYQHGKGDRWLHDLRRWTRVDKKRRETDPTDVLKTVSGATRSPGKYKLQWDGRDEAGQPVAQGKYTVYIEVVREHGTYQLMKEDVEVGTKPFTSRLKFNTEIQGASIEYQQKSAPAEK